MKAKQNLSMSVKPDVDTSSRATSRVCDNVSGVAVKMTFELR